MDAAFSFSNYVIKTQGLAIAGKYVVHTVQDKPVLWVKHKTSLKAPYVRHYAYGDSKRTVEVMTMIEADHPEFVNYYEVIDKSEGVTVGGICLDWDNFFTDAFAIVDAQGEVIAGLRETSTARGLAHEFSSFLVSQAMKIAVGDQVVAELRQKRVWRGKNLHVDFTMDPAGLLDRRLGLATAIVLAAHQGATETG